MSFLAPEDFHLLLWLSQAKLLNLCELVDTEDAPDVLAVLHLCQLRIQQSNRQGLTFPASLRKHVEYPAYLVWSALCRKKSGW